MSPNSQPSVSNFNIAGEADCTINSGDAYMGNDIDRQSRRDKVGYQRRPSADSTLNYMQHQYSMDTIHNIQQQSFGPNR